MATGADIAIIKALGGYDLPDGVLSLYVALTDEKLLPFEGSFPDAASLKRAGEIFACHLIDTTKDLDPPSLSAAGLSVTYQQRSLGAQRSLLATRWGSLFLDLYGMLPGLAPATVGMRVVE